MVLPKKRDCCGKARPIFLAGAIFFAFSLISHGTVQAQLTANSAITPIHEINMDRDNDGNADLQGDTVTVAGRANVATGLFHEVYLQIFIQNDIAGISLFSSSFDQPVARGDSVVATGVVQQYFGMTEINVLEYEVHQNSEPLPKPIPLEVALQNPADYEGMVVGGTATITGNGSKHNGKYLKISPSEDNPDSILVYVSNFHSQYRKFDLDMLTAGDNISVSGIMSMYNPGKSDNENYRIFLRTPEDLDTIGLTQYTLIILGSVGIIISILVVGWIVSLKSTVRSKTKKIRQSLEEKEVLLREIHHRIKNNLAIISGLIELQMEKSMDRGAHKVLRDSQSRIQSMALVHDKLYRTTTVSDIGMQTYIEELVESLKSTFTESDSDIELQFDIDDIRLDIDRAIPCGLLINELVVNSFKHAFTDGEGLLKVKFKKVDDSYRLIVADNGLGLPENYEDKMQSSLGLMLVDTFKRQLEAEMTVENRNGAHFAIEFPSNPTQ